MTFWVALSCFRSISFEGMVKTEFHEEARMHGVQINDIDINVEKLDSQGALRTADEC